MGLLYPFPVAKDEVDFIQIQPEQITLKSYGLPYIFWGYAFMSIMMILLLLLAVKEPAFKLISMGDDIDKMLAISLLSFGAILPIVILSFFFFEKRIIYSSQKKEIALEYRFFFIRVFKESFPLTTKEQLRVGAFMDTPNQARLKHSEGTSSFENKGYFILWLNQDNKKPIMIDRHSRKADLEKLKDLILNTI